VGTKDDYIAFIADARRSDLPVKFLQEVASSNYSFVPGWTSLVFPTINVMMLHSSDLPPSGYPSFESLGVVAGVGTVYHESTHAWIDINSGRPQVAALIASGIQHYESAPLEQGRTADEPDRIFQEAIASYVGHRAASYLHTCIVLKQVDSKLKRGVRMEERSLKRFLQIARQASDEYDRNMSERLFGYQNQGWVWEKGDSQKETLRGMTNAMKRFADELLLENMIPDFFSRTSQPAAIWRKLQREYASQLQE
jgi:hypothetical protein